MATAATKTTYTPEDLLAMPGSVGYELVDGQLVERDMGAASSWVGGELLFAIRLYLKDHPLGWALPADAGYQCFPDAPNKVRKPDVSFIRHGRLEGERLPEGFLRIPPDLVVEVISKNDLASEVEQKLVEYQRAGVRLVWVVNPETKTIRIQRADGTSGWLLEQGELDGEDVLPGLRIPVRDLFPPQPPPA